MNAVIYARYSSHAQREESIEQQVAVCREYCERRGYDVLRVYSDAAKSGRSTEGREAFAAMIADARAGEFGAVVVYKLDRFARDRYDSVLNKKRLRDCGVVVLSAMENIPEGPEGRLMESVIEGVAEWYSADLSQKTRRGMLANAEKCMANGVAVFGYDVGEDGRYVVNEGQAAIVRRIFAEWLAGRPGAHIARDLAAEGVRTAAGRRPGKNFAFNVIHDARYRGVYRWGDVTIDGGMPAIVDAETFRVANLRKRATAAPNRTHEYPLVGRIYDHETGAAMTGYSGRSKGKEYLYYSANVDGRHYLVRREVLEGAVVRAVTGAFKDAAFVDDVLDRIDALRDRVGDSDDVTAARATVRECRAEERRLAALRDGDYVPAVVVRMLRENEERLNAAEEVVKRSKRDAATRDEVRDFLENMRERATDEEIIAHMVYRVEVFRADGAVVVTLPIVTHEKALNPAGGFSAVHGWLPTAVLGSKSVAWRVTETAVLLFARVA